jgi:ATP-dependent helicase/nuclease subunit A
MREYRRLLYVALTRPRDRLIICGHETGRTKTGTEEGCWYDLVTDAMQRLGAKAIKQADGGEILRIGSIPGDTTVDMPVAPTVRELAPGLPYWITRRAPAETVPEPLLATDRFRKPSPSAEATSEHGKVLDRGLAVHRILDAMAGLPELRWAPVALEIAREMLVPSMVQGVVTEALRVRQDPAFAELFAVNSRGEFPLRGELEWQGRVHKFDWRLDRLVVRETDVLVLEFKTDQVVPRADSAVRPQYVRQLALYRRAVSSLFPGKAVSCGILWTVEPRLQVIPANMLDAAEHALDPPVGGS